MKHKFLFVIMLTALYNITSCGTVSDPESVGINLITENGLRTHLRFLSDDLLEGRGTGSRGLKIAGNYMAAQFEHSGVKPGGDNGTFFQTVPMVGYTANTPATFEFVKGSQKYALNYLDDFVVNTAKAETRVTSTL